MNSLKVRTALLFLQPPGLLARLRARLLGPRPDETMIKEPHGYERPPRASPVNDHAERTVETITAYASPRPDAVRRRDVA